MIKKNYHKCIFSIRCAISSKYDKNISLPNIALY